MYVLQPSFTNQQLTQHPDNIEFEIGSIDYNTSTFNGLRVLYKTYWQATIFSADQTQHYSDFINDICYWYIDEIESILYHEGRTIVFWHPTMEYNSNLRYALC